MSPKIRRFESLATCCKQQPPPSSTSNFKWQHVGDGNMLRQHVVVGGIDLSKSNMSERATCLVNISLVDSDLNNLNTSWGHSVSQGGTTHVVGSFGTPGRDWTHRGVIR